MGKFAEAVRVLKAALAEDAADKLTAYASKPAKVKVPKTGPSFVSRKGKDMGRCYDSGLALIGLQRKKSQ